MNLRKVTEPEGGADEAEALARRVASHLGLEVGRRRDSAARRAQDARARRMAKYAVVPLAIVCVAMLAMFVFRMLIAPVG